ncbi:MAG TPA: hypothetical protein VMR29_07115 [Candidatus Binatia bacterium]|nr:hypothetical protein [Candidatus Binatia bacterium]
MAATIDSFDDTRRLDEPALRDLLDHGRPEERVWAMWALALRSADVGELARRDEPDAGVRRSLAVVLAGHGQLELLTALARRDPAPHWQAPFMLAFTGIRGIVSLAAALAIPLTTTSGAPFPDRDLILFVTFCVIVVTLVGQGLLMPAVIRRLGLADVGRAERRAEALEELASRRQAIERVTRRIDELATERKLPVEIVEPLTTHHRGRLRRLDYKLGDDEREKELERVLAELERELIEAERKHVYELACNGQLKDDARRRIENELDLHEAELARTTPGSGNEEL